MKDEWIDPQLHSEPAYVYQDGGARPFDVIGEPAPPAEPDAAALRAAVIDFFTYREIDIEEADGWPVSQRARDRRLVKWNEWIDQWLAARAAAAEEAEA